VQAQEESEGFESPGQAVTEARVNLRPSPGTNEAPLRTLAKGSKLRLIESEPVSDFYRVLTSRGELGWVHSDFVTVDTSSPEAHAAMAATTRSGSGQACVEDLGDCPKTGCAPSGSKGAVFNATKRRSILTSSGRLLKFSDFKTLQTQAQKLVSQGKELTQSDRNKLSGLTVSGGVTVKEGSQARIVGFISKDSDPHANKKESVNCRLTGAESNDFHFSITPDPDDSEFESIVVEMVPQGRKPGWTLARLKRARDEERKVMVVGRLFYDNDHVVNADAAHNIGGQPARFSLWELHPVARCYVCERADNSCSPSQVSQWKKLEDF